VQLEKDRSSVSVRSAPTAIRNSDDSTGEIAGTTRIELLFLVCVAFVYHFVAFMVVI